MDNECGDDENDMLGSSSTSSLLLPTINEKNFDSNAGFKEEFLRLTSLVRRVYYNYLHKSLLNNYAFSCQAKDVEDFDSRIKSCASQMELVAVQSALETSLYRQVMSKIISEVKDHTNEKKLYKTLTSYLISPPVKVDIAVQTDQIGVIKTENLSSPTLSTNLKNDPSENNRDPNVAIKTEPPSNEINTETQLAPKHSISNSNSDLDFQTLNQSQTIEREDQSFPNESEKSKLEDSQDSLFQTMEDMFYGSDDSSDLTTLIERHSSTHSENSVSKKVPKPSEVVNNLEKLESRGTKRKHNPTINHVKSKRQSLKNSPVGFNEMKDSRYRKKVEEIWLVERVNQTSKLKAKMLEISLTDYRKYGRIKEKFLELFGESDNEDALPESPVCIEEHLRACKGRIAPWVVKHLSPYFNQNRIASRELFKIIGKHVTDMLIINETFPEEKSVENYLQDFFRNKKSIETEADIYL